MKILLLGKNGQVGWQLQRALAPLGEIVALERKDAGGDLADPQGLAAAVRAAGHAIVPLPGAISVTAALSVAGAAGGAGIRRSGHGAEGGQQ